MYCTGTFGIFECCLEQCYKAKQLRKKAHYRGESRISKRGFCYSNAHKARAKNFKPHLLSLKSRPFTCVICSCFSCSLVQIKWFYQGKPEYEPISQHFLSLKSFLFSILVISNSVQHDREDFRQIRGVVLGERGFERTKQTPPGSTIALTIVKISNYFSLSCLLWWLSAPFFHTVGECKACSVAWAVELSAIFVVKLKEHGIAATRFHHFWRILWYFCALWPISISTHCGQVYSGEYFAKFVLFQSLICK